MRLSKGIEKIEDKTLEVINTYKEASIAIAKKLKEYASRPSTKKKVRNLVIGGALVGILVSQKGCKLTKDSDLIKTNDADNINKIMQSAEREIGPHLSFDPNSGQELINRVAEVYVDAASKGLGDLTIEQWMDWYMVTNIDDISPVEYYKMLDDTKTTTTVMENYDFVNNALLEDAITATPFTMINIDRLVADTKSAQELSSFQSALTSYNVASDGSKKKIADDVNEYLYNEFVTNKHDAVTASSNLTRMKLLLATWELTNNYSWTVPSADISKIMYTSDNTNCDLTTDANGISVWNEQKTVVKKTVEEKMDMMFKFMLTEDKTQQDARIILRSLEIEMAIQDLVNKMGLVKVANPSSEQAIIDSKPQIPGKTITPEQKKHIVTNPVTGKEEVHLPPVTNEVVPNQELLKEVEVKNQNEELRSKGVRDGAKNGNSNGYHDGSNANKFNDKPLIDLSKEDKIYADAYLESYIKYYTEGYTEGKKLYDGPIKQKEEIISNKQAEEDVKKIMIADGKENGQTAGDTQGYKDGYNGKRYDDSVKVKHDDKNYKEAYINAYEKAYRKAYREGERDYEDYIEKIKKESNKNHKSVDKDYFEEKTYKNKDGGTTTEEIELLPGFYEKDGKIFDEDGNEVEIIGSNNINQNIAALKTLRSVLESNMDNTNDISLDKVKII
ncbi:MAG: hypothetical protein PHW32_01980 [Bacilli bacterium]|nr:hypothetical protein [Bacilli bacterium]MDD4282234.1 hypothetical protein [Bacilli bacterium]MDD4718614.1 hypothetical protein [Bacilli bacterium]